MKLVKPVFFVIFLFFSNIILCQKGILTDYNFSEPFRQIKLGKELNEISGLGLNKNLLYAHNDEFSTIFLLDQKTGKIVERFYFGKKFKKGDFEDLIFIKNRFFIAESNGHLYSFQKPENGLTAKCSKIKTGLKSKNDIEGLEFLEKENSLLLLCKESAGKGYKGYRAIYEFNLASQKLVEKPKYLIDLEEVKSLTGRKSFNPSAMKITDSETILILDGKGKSIVEIDLSGNILNAVKLNKKIHKQPEGIEILRNGTIIISDEAVKGKATLTYYQK